MSPAQKKIHARGHMAPIRVKPRGHSADARSLQVAARTIYFFGAEDGSVHKGPNANLSTQGKRGENTEKNSEEAFPCVFSVSTLWFPVVKAVL